MAYFTPYVGQEGLQIPSYADIENLLVDSARSIFGQDIYLANDSQDFQWIAAVSRMAYETLLTAQLAYNTRGPATAIGVGLDGVVASNGITRKSATNSTATVVLTGTPFTLITNGVVADISGNAWNLPSSVTLNSGGTATVTATCQTKGAITALAGQINIIQTPTFGWSSVTNPAAATPGQPVETDSSLRSRQALSVANPSQALVSGILGSILAVDNVLNAKVYENDTNVPESTIDGAFNPNDFPPHSITAVVEGGDGQSIADAISVRKTPGCYTDGDEVYNVIDANGVVTPIRFYRSIPIGIDVEITITALAGYTSNLGDQMIQAVVDYINRLEIGQPVIISELWQAALSVDNNQYARFSLTLIEAGIHASGEVLSPNDIDLEFNQQAETIIPYVTLTVN